jgi:hypothetical protein
MAFSRDSYLATARNRATPPDSKPFKSDLLASWHSKLDREVTDIGEFPRPAVLASADV